MPTYHYACDDCRYEFELEQRITEKPIKKCPECGKLKARRMIAGGGFILKGGGWESDLYSGPSNRSAKASKTADSTATKSADSSSVASTSTSSKAGTSSKSDA